MIVFCNIKWAELFGSITEVFHVFVDFLCVCSVNYFIDERSWSFYDCEFIISPFNCISFYLYFEALFSRQIFKMVIVS